MLKITNLQGNANCNNDEIPPTPIRKATIKTNKKKSRKTASVGKDTEKFKETLADCW